MAKVVLQVDTQPEVGEEGYDAGASILRQFFTTHVRQFLLRGKGNVQGEWQLICTGHNLLKLFGARNAGLVGEEFWGQVAAT